MIEDGLIALVNADPALGPMLAGRFYDTTLPEGASVKALGVCGTFQVVGGSADAPFENHGPQKWRMQFDFYAASAYPARNARAALFNLLDGFMGALPDGTFVTGAEQIQAMNNFDSDARNYRCAAEYYVNFNL